MADKLLIIEDDPDFLALLVAGAAKIGIQCVTAGDGNTALQILEKEPIRMALLDLILPVLDGIQILQRIRETRSKRDLPVIIVSSVDDPERIVEAFNAGANDFINKPVNLDVLAARMRNQLDDGTRVGPAAKPAESSTESTALVDGRSYNVFFLHVQLLIHPELARMREGADIAEMMNRIFGLFADTAEKYNVRVWNRKEDSCLFGYTGEDPHAAFLACVELFTMMTVYNMANENPPGWIALSAGITLGPAIYRNDISAIYSEALNTSVHLVKHAEPPGGIRIDDSIYGSMRPGAKAYFTQESSEKAGVWVYKFP